MKNFLALCLLSLWSMAVLAVDYATYKPQQQNQGTIYSTAEASQGNPQGASFNSTSAYSKQLDAKAARPINPVLMTLQREHTYTVPVAAASVTGGVTTEDYPGSGPRRIGSRPEDSGNDPVDPDSAPDMPIGDTPWLWMALLALGYAAFRVCRFRNSGVQED